MTTSEQVGDFVRGLGAGPAWSCLRDSKVFDRKHMFERNRENVMGKYFGKTISSEQNCREIIVTFNGRTLRTSMKNELFGSSLGWFFLTN